MVLLKSTQVDHPLEWRNMAKKDYYNIGNLLSTDAEYMILLGQRANGKSYQAKETALKESYKTGKKFVYLRRWKDDIKAASVEKYFADMPIEKITKGEYDHIKAWHNNLYFAQHDDNGKVVRGPEIGMYAALNESERYKSWAFTDPKTGENAYMYIIYEEFITDKLYLVDEPSRLQQFVSTVFRNNRGHVLLVGNTLSRVCPYFIEWCLDGTLQQKIGTIEVYHYHTEEGGVIDIAVERCGTTTQKNLMFFGQSEKQIVSGEWDTKEVPHLPKKYEDYEMVYEILIEYQKFRFVLQLLIEPKEGGAIVYIYPYTKHREILRKISSEFTDNIWTTKKLDPKRFKAEAVIMDCFRIGKVCYSDNLSGADFNHINSIMKFV